MKTITVNDVIYTLEYSFEAAEHKQTVQNMFNIMSGAYLLKGVTDIDKDNKENVAIAMIEGTGDMVSDIPLIVKTAFYAGLLENHSFSEEEAHLIMKEYMKENKISFKKLFDDIKECMEEDGFFDLSGLTDMITEMNQSVEPKKKSPKVPQDHKKKSTSTK